jgi:hypothetical protein
MSIKTKMATLIGALALLSGTAVAAAVATSGSASGPAGVVEAVTGDRIDTPSGVFLPVTSQTFTAGNGPIVVRFSGEGLVEDWNSMAGFVGKQYAAMKVRVLLDGVQLAPGAVTFVDNGGQIAQRSPLASPRGRAAAFDWAGTVATTGQHTVTVEFRNLHTWDSATLLRWTLIVQHA